MPYLEYQMLRGSGAESIDKGLHADRGHRSTADLLDRCAHGHQLCGDAVPADGESRAEVGAGCCRAGTAGQSRTRELRISHGRHDDVVHVDSRRNVLMVHHRERLDSAHQARAGDRHPRKWSRARLQRIHLQRATLVGVRQAGFTLLEAILALTLSSVIVGLVSSVFLAQNDFYRLVVQRTRVQDNLRVVTDLIASEIRGASNGGVITAESRRFVVRLPLTVGGVCHGQGAAWASVYAGPLGDRP